MSKRESTRILESYRSMPFIMLPLEVSMELGTNPAIALSVLMSRYEFHASKEELTKEGTFYLTIQKMEEISPLTEKMQRKAFKELEDRGLVKRTYHVSRDGKLRYVQLYWNKIKQFIAQYLPVKEENNENENDDEPNSPKDSGATDQMAGAEPTKRPISYMQSIKARVLKPFKPKHYRVTSISSSSTKKELQHKKRANGKRDEENKAHLDPTYHQVLQDFLQSKGWNQTMILATSSKCVETGVTSFTIADLEDAYTSYVKKVTHDVVYSPADYFSGGISLAIVNRITKESADKAERERLEAYEASDLAKEESFFAKFKKGVA